MTAIRFVTYGLFWVYYRILHAFWLLHYTQLAKRPQQVQASLLRRILRDNKQTQFGVEFNFAYTQSGGDYQEAIGLQDYPEIEQMLRSQETTGRRLLCEKEYIYVQKSFEGVHSNLFPLTLSDYRHAQRNVRIAAYAWHKHYGLWRHRVFSILVDVPTSLSLTGLPQGTEAGFIYRNLPRFMRNRCIAPQEVAEIREPHLRYVAHAILALSDPNITGVLTANPATLIHLLHVINKDFEEICEAIEIGKLPVSNRSNVPQSERFKLRANPRRANQLRDLKKAKEKLSFLDFWPKLHGVICWKSGGCSIASAHLRSKLGTSVPILELATPSAAILGSINIDTRTTTCVPLLRQNFYEFAERFSWDSGFAQLKHMDQLNVGSEYYVFITTGSGIYRIETGHAIKVTGKIHDTPTFEFVQNRLKITSLQGERLSETEVIAAVSMLNERFGCKINQFMVLCNVEKSRYELYLESDLELNKELVQTQFDDGLSSQSPLWLSKRLTERMGLPEVHQIQSGTIDAYRAESLTDGSIDATYVLPHLQFSSECELDFESVEI